MFCSDKRAYDYDSDLKNKITNSTEKKSAAGVQRSNYSNGISEIAGSVISIASRNHAAFKVIHFENETAVGASLLSAS